MTLANKITILRIVLIPIIIVGLTIEAAHWPAWLFLISALTDVLDGALARWRQERSVLGSFLDPVADKLLSTSSFLTLALLGRTPMWVFVVVLSREILILTGWNIIFILTQKPTLSPRWLGKITTFLQMAAVVSVLFQALHPVYPIVLWGMVAFTGLSTLDYVWVGSRRLSEIDRH